MRTCDWNLQHEKRSKEFMDSQAGVKVKLKTLLELGNQK